MRWLLAVAGVLLALLPCTPAVATEPAVDAVERDLLARIDGLRAGHTPLQSHPQLAAAAHAQAAWLVGLSPDAVSGLTAHTGHCGGPGCPAQRAAQAGWPDPGTVLAEVIQLGGRSHAPSPQVANAAAISAWQASPLHREQLHAAGWVYAGVAVAGDMTVVIFGRACTVALCLPGTGHGALLPPLLGQAPAGATNGGAAAGSRTGASPPQAGRCAPSGLVRVLARGERRVRVELRMTCRRPGMRYRMRVRDGRRKRTATLRRSRAVFTVPASRRARWLRVTVAEGRRPLGTVTVRVGARARAASGR